MKNNLPVKSTGRWVEPNENKIQIRLNWFDKMVGFFSPRALLGRQKARIFNDFVKRKYEAADSGRRTDGWNTGGGSANAEIAAAQFRAKNRARDLVRNNPYAARGVQVITNNVIGRGIKTQIKTGNDTRDLQLMRVWRGWADTPACDYEGIHDFSGIQRLAMRAVVESGEVFIRLRREPKRKIIGPDGKLVEVPPISLQVLESDFVSLNKTLKTGADKNPVLQGVEFDKDTGKRVAYHMFLQHPGSNDFNFGASIRTVRILASDILHLHRVDRPGQVRGMTWFNAVVLRLRDFDIYEDAQLKRQQCAAMFTAFIHDLEGVDEFEETKEEVEIGEKMEPGLMEVLPPGKSITLSRPPGAENYGEYTSVVLHAIASGLGITFFQLTGNLSDINFSAGRLGFLETQRNFDTWRSIIVMGQFINPVFSWFRDALPLAGASSENIRGVHTPPKREMIDPTKEVEALKTAVRSGFKSQSDAVRELGKDPDLHFQEISDDNKKLDDLGIVLDTDARKVNKAGTPSNSKSTEEESVVV